MRREGDAVRCETDAVRSGTDAVRCGTDVVRCEGDARSDLQGHRKIIHHSCATRKLDGQYIDSCNPLQHS